MKNNKNHRKHSLLTLTLLLIGQLSFSQDVTMLNLSIDSITYWAYTPDSFLITSTNHPDLISHSPSKEDSLYCKAYSNLITVKPTQKNHLDYYKMACSLWQMGKLQEAEKMFLRVINSKAPYYATTYYHSSDIPGDTTTNIYGYGSYTSNYKNSACLYLTKIYIEEEKFDDALKYIVLADKKYTVEYNCGTGYLMYRDKINDLYGIIYEGLGKYDNIIQLFLPEYSTYSSERLSRALKQVYTSSEINDYLKIAENSIICVLDSVQSSTFTIQNFGEKDEITTEIKYISGTATMRLFDKVVTLPKPNLKNGAIATKELFIKEFKATRFYAALIDN